MWNRIWSVLGCLAMASQLAAAPLIINEYNAVSATNTLDDGEGQDSFFGILPGNGGNWIELLVIDDHVDLRDWTLQWAEMEQVGALPEDTAEGEIRFGQHDVWSDLRAGTIITLIETADAEAQVGPAGETYSTPTDSSYDPEAGDWWINISTREEAAKGDAAALITTVTNDGMAGDFSVGKDDWMVKIVDWDGEDVFGPLGEGAADWPGGGVSSKEGGSLEGPVPTEENPAAITLADWQAITPTNPFYDDTGSTTFGAPNAEWDAMAMTFLPYQDLSPLRDQVIGQPLGDGDFNMDGTLDIADLDGITEAVKSGSQDAVYDVDLNGTVDATDRTLWIERVRGTYIGDANLDGEFNTSDFVSVFQAGEYEDDVAGNSTWTTGDWNGDGEFDTTDFVAAFQAGGYELGPRAAVAAVPEPSSLFGLLMGVAALVGCRVRRK